MATKRKQARFRVTVEMSADLLKWVDEIAIYLGHSRSEVIAGFVASNQAGYNAIAAALGPKEIAKSSRLKTVAEARAERAKRRRAA